MPKLLTLMLVIIGASVGLLTALILLQSETNSGPPPGSPCAFEKGTLNSIIIPGFVHQSNADPGNIFEGQLGSRSTECTPEESSQHIDAIESVVIQEMSFDSEESALEAVRDLRGFGEVEPTREQIAGRDVEVIRSESVNYLNMVWRSQRAVMSITVIGLFEEDVEMERLENLGRSIVTRILGET